jgi:hypothetical protein
MYGHESAGVAGMIASYWLLMLAVTIFGMVCMWKIFTKAGQPGWAAIIPIYNAYILLKIVGRPGWWLVLLFIPFVNLVVAILIAIELAKCFGQSGAFAVGLILLSIIFYAILAFGDAKYRGVPAQPAA